MLTENLRERLRPLYTAAAWMTIAMLIIIPVQIVVLALSPHPTTVQGWLDLFAGNWLLGLIHFDALYLIDNILILFIYAALFLLLAEKHPVAMISAFLLGFLGIAAYMSSNTAVEMFFLTREYLGGGSGLPDEVFLAAAQNLILRWKGTAFDIYYILNGVTLFLIAYSMLNDPGIRRGTALMALISALFMLIPSNFGTLGLVFSLLSLIPWYIFSLMLVPIFFTEGRRKQ